MQFTYKAYISLLDLLRKNNYHFCAYDNYPRNSRCVILRHDIDYSLEQAIKLAETESSQGISSTYFVLLTSDFYNPASSASYQALHRIIELGHNIGLHFDETAYIYDVIPLEYYIRKEARILSDLLDVNINCFSLHRPNRITLETGLRIPGLTNAYGEEFFMGFKYLSDSRRRWREPIEDIIKSNKYERLHILTHAFWYHEHEQNLHDSLNEFINTASSERLSGLRENITDLDSILND
ncbi:MAG: hypothetical protein K5663_05705 [Clostridiales bacterium]|nr:hypothetical protein [Clostridiales bacterium]